MNNDIFNTYKDFKISATKKGKFYSLPGLAKKLNCDLQRLPVSIRIVLESVLRNCDGKKITEEHVKQLANWKPVDKRENEIPFVVSRVVLQDFTGVPLLADLAAMRNVAASMGKNPKNIEPLVPVDLIVDHSVQIDSFGNANALDLNMQLEFNRNKERYQFIKWGMQAFDTFNVVPPGFGIVHQINLEYLARGVHSKKSQDKSAVYYPDTLVGTDSHTTMINGIGVVGWGVGGIEAEAAMLGQPVYLLTPDVVGVNLTGVLRGGVTATDLVLTITEILRQAKVVGKFVEFFGTGAASLSVTDRATISNMAPEYGATMGFFPIDDATVKFFKNTGRNEAEIDAFVSYFKAQNMFGMPSAGEIDYTQVITLDLGTVTPSVAGPKRPQDRIEIGHVANTFTQLFTQEIAQGGFNKDANDLTHTYSTKDGGTLRQGDILIAAITSCTNTSNPAVMLAAGLLAKKAVKAGLRIAPHIKTSLAPGSRVVTQYLKAAKLLPYLEKLGFNVAAYGCTTCIGNAGDLIPEISQAITKNDVVACAVLSGNRNFEARIHPLIRANFLASPPLVIAYALAGNITVDLMTQPIANVKGKDIYIGDIWPSSAEIEEVMQFANNAQMFKKNYANISKAPGKLWENIQDVVTGDVYNWPVSTYIAQPPFFSDFTITPLAQQSSIKGARALGIFGDSITTDHISPAGSFKKNTPAGHWLTARGVDPFDFNSYGSRRGHHEVMMRGTFANVRIKNLMIPPNEDGSRTEGGYTLYQPSGEQLSIYDAAMQYVENNVPTVIFAGEEYGTGSSRDWAAKGTYLLGVKAVIASSYERIHRSNLVGMGVLPLQFLPGQNAGTLNIQGGETFDITGIDGDIKPQQQVTLTIHRADGTSEHVPVLLRIDTPIEIDYYQHKGILPFVLRQLLATA